jgi:hypothetical protein
MHVTLISSCDRSGGQADMAKSVLLTLSGSPSAAYPVVPGGDEPLRRGEHVFISYCWKQQALALRVRDALRASGYRVWVDVEQMVGSIFECMAEGIERASAAVLLYSQAYAASRNCMAEAMYIAQTNTFFVPCFAEVGCDAIHGPLALMRGTKIYVDFADPDSTFELSMAILTKQLSDRGHVAAAPSAAPAAESPLPTPCAEDAMQPPRNATMWHKIKALPHMLSKPPPEVSQAQQQQQQQQPWQQPAMQPPADTQLTRRVERIEALLMLAGALAVGVTLATTMGGFVLAAVLRRRDR